MGIFNRLFGSRRDSPLPPPEPKLWLAESCHRALQQCLAPSQASRNEGVCFLLGRTDGNTAVCITAVRPKAKTGPGYFHVPAFAMAEVLEIAMDLDLQIVAQVHTHPVDAFHSDGDEDGANIRYDGFVSIVLPNYGAQLPAFSGAAIYHYRAASGWTLLPEDALTVCAPGFALDGK
jgi:proteasome lid subunit RPN8/RPN11